MKKAAIIMFALLFVSMTPFLATAGEIKTAVLKVEGMTCSLCVPAVKKALEKTEGVKKAEVSYSEGKAVVEYESEKTNVQELIKAIEKVGYKAGLWTNK